jgi:hypothetical protein
MRSILFLLFAGFTAAACGPIVPPVPPVPPVAAPGDPGDLVPGSLVELSRTDLTSEFTLRVPATVFVVQNGRQLFTIDVANELPRKISIPVRSLDDRSGLPIQLIALNLGTRIMRFDDQCLRCQPGGDDPGRPCCPSPPTVGPLSFCR